jgi:hypothetical protein
MNQNALYTVQSKDFLGIIQKPGWKFDIFPISK